MRNQPPMRAAPHRGAESIGRLSQTSASVERVVILRPKKSVAGAERQPARQITISAVCTNRDRFHAGKARIEIQIDKGNVHIGARVFFALRRPARSRVEKYRSSPGFSEEWRSAHE